MLELLRGHPLCSIVQKHLVDISNWVMWKNMDLRCMFVNTPNHNKNISHFQLPPGHDKTDYNRADASENEQE